MPQHQIQDEKECLRRVVEYLNQVASQPMDGHCTESNRIRYLRNAVLGKRWATTTLKTFYTAQYSFD